MLVRGIYRIAGITRMCAARFCQSPKQPSRFERHHKEIEYLIKHPDKRQHLTNLQKLQRSMSRAIKKLDGDGTDPISSRRIEFVKNLISKTNQPNPLRGSWFFQGVIVATVFLYYRSRSTPKKQERKKETQDPRNFDYLNMESIEVREKQGANMRSYEAILRYKDGNLKHLDVVNPNVFLENVEAAQKEFHPNGQPIPVYYKHGSKFNWLEAIHSCMQIVMIGAIVTIMLGLRKGFRVNMLLGKSPVKKIHSEKDLKVKFKDVAGMEQAKLEITEFVDFLKNNAKFKEMGAKIPRGALLTGPPGTGKTMLAKACASEAGVPFYYMSGSEFIEMFVGVGAARVRDLFAEAKAEAPSIIFIDEIDTIGKKRSGSSNEEKDSTLNQLLVEMDGFKTDQNVIVLAATNRRDVLDSALTRPGRFDRLIEVELPDINGRIEIFLVHLKPLKLDPTRTLDEFAKRLATLTPGFSGADIGNLCNEAAILAARRASTFVEAKDFENATERVLAGLEKKNLMTPENKKTVAYHEAGHAVTAWFLEGGDPLVKVTIIPRSKGSLGYAQYLPRESALKTKEQLMDRVIIILGGRMAEEHFFGKVTTGAADDLQKVYELTRAMVTQFGMSEVIGNIGFEEENYINKYSQKTGAKIDEEIKLIVQQAEQRCRNLIQQKRNLIEKLALELMQKETLTTQNITTILGERPFQTDDYKKYLEMANS